VAGDEYRDASLRIWEEMAAGWLIDAQDPQPGALSTEIEWRLRPYAEGDGYRGPGMCLNVLAA
jgi:hypothetical protein